MESRTHGCTRVLVFEENALLRTALSALVDHQADLVTCDSAGTPDVLLRMAEMQQPDVVVLGIPSSEEWFLPLIAKLAERRPGVHVLVLSVSDLRPGARRAAAAGASGYVSKYSDPATLISGIRAVAAGVRYGLENGRGNGA